MRKHVKKELLWICAAASAALLLTRNRRAALLPLVAGGALLLKKSRNESFIGHSVVITGGSRGLGFALAREFLKEGAQVTLIARDTEELRIAKSKLENPKLGAVHTIVCDITEPEKLQTAIGEAAKKFGGVDVLINNAGAITVGPWESMTPQDFEAQMKLHVYAPMNAIRAALPFLRDPMSGKRIVNICSLGGRVAVPHMLPYDTSKFALAGFSQGVGAELSREGISVTTIYPALMRTGSPIQAVFKGDHEKEFAWFQSGDVFPWFSMPAQEAAKKIVQAARERRWELMPSWPAKIRVALGALLPELMGHGMGLINRMMPVGQSANYQTGEQSRKLFDRSPWTQSLVDRAHEAEAENNQSPKKDPKYNMGLH